MSSGPPGDLKPDKGRPLSDACVIQEPLEGAGGSIYDKA
jgi:hypothetical protein